MKLIKKSYSNIKTNYELKKKQTTNVQEKDEINKMHDKYILNENELLIVRINTAPFEQYIYILKYIFFKLL